MKHAKKDKDVERQARRAQKGRETKKKIYRKIKRYKEPETKWHRYTEVSTHTNTDMEVDSETHTQ